MEGHEQLVIAGGSERGALIRYWLLWLFQIVMAAQQPDADTLFRRGMAFAREGKYEDAEKALREGYSAFPNDARFAIELAGVSYRKKDPAAARHYLHEALRVKPDEAYANEFLASLYALEDNIAAALKYWNRTGKPVMQGLRVEPAPRLDPVLLARSVAISGGQVFTSSRLHSTDAALERLGLFASHRYELAPRDDGRFDGILRVTQSGSGLGGWLGRVLPLARGLPYQAIHFDRLNIGEQAINLRSLWRWDRVKRRAAIEVSGPLKKDPRYGFRFVADARDEEWELPDREMVVQKMQAGGDILLPLAGWQWSTGVRFTRRWRFVNGWGYSLRNEVQRTVLRVPEKRLTFDSGFVLDTGNAEGRYGRFQGDLRGEWFPQSRGETWTVRTRLRSGIAWGRVPFDELFQLGVERDNDLWLRGHEGTRDGRKGAAPIGKRYGLAQFEVDRSVWQWGFVDLKAGPFFDVGWIRPQGWMPDAGVQAKLRVMRGITWTVVYGRDLRGGRGVFYTAVGR